MEDEAILLKIKRDFTTNEAVQSLLKIIQELEIEIGVLKSERDEAIDRAAKIEVEGKPKKAWLKDEVVALLQEQMKNQQAKNTATNKAMNDWRNKYFSLAAKINNS